MSIRDPQPRAGVYGKASHARWTSWSVGLSWGHRARTKRDPVIRSGARTDRPHPADSTIQTQLHIVDRGIDKDGEVGPLVIPNTKEGPRFIRSLIFKDSRPRREVAKSFENDFLV